MQKLEITVYKRTDQKWDWRAKRGNAIVATSGGQGYENVGDCEETLKNYLDSIKAGDYIINREK